MRSADVRSRGIAADAPAGAMLGKGGSRRNRMTPDIRRFDPSGRGAIGAFHALALRASPAAQSPLRGLMLLRLAQKHGFSRKCRFFVGGTPVPMFSSATHPERRTRSTLRAWTRQSARKRRAAARPATATRRARPALLRSLRGGVRRRRRRRTRQPRRRRLARGRARRRERRAATTPSQARMRRPPRRHAGARPRPRTRTPTRAHRQCRPRRSRRNHRPARSASTRSLHLRKPRRPNRHRPQPCRPSHRPIPPPRRHA